MRPVETIVKVKKHYKTHIPKNVFDAVGAKPGDLVRVQVSPVEDE
jgi:bifunctional DNA-binding transcriptional regulator/antitoxin component of YhaV-PrlF toxin-antitoxin module